MQPFCWLGVSYFFSLSFFSSCLRACCVGPRLVQPNCRTRCWVAMPLKEWGWEWERRSHGYDSQERVVDDAMRRGEDEVYVVY